MIRSNFCGVAGGAQRALVWSSAVFGLCVAPLLPACQSETPQVGSQTNWLKSCDSPSDCGDLVCLCGTCTAACDGESDCGDLTDSCIDAGDPGATAACDGNLPTIGMCLPRCGEEPCPEGTACLSGVCVASRGATASLSVDTTVRFQELVGFGASLGFSETFIANHPEREALLDAMFLDSGFDVIRLRNRATDFGVDLGIEAQIIEDASARIGRVPALFLTSGSPPAALKANGDPFCQNADPACTLARDGGGEFDYAGFAEYWRASLEAYDAAGIVPTYVSVQSNADWIPPDELGAEACRFLPAQGIQTVMLPDGQMVDAEFPGYDQAMSAVAAAVATLPGEYSFSGPEAGSAVMVPAYEASLSETTSVSFHLFGMDPLNVAVDQLAAIRQLAQDAGKPSLQTEMTGDGLGTAILAHHTLVDAGSAAYLQQSFVGNELDEGAAQLIGTDGAAIVKLPPFHALSHFARFTDPGYTRVEAVVDAEGVLASAWIAPDDSALAIVLVNPEMDGVDVEVNVSDAALVGGMQVLRTTFNGVERSAQLGPLPDDGVVRVPPQSIVTLAVPED